MRGETTEDALIALIADDPRADGPRLVLADYYAERADPRGELMALQLATRRQGGHEARLRMLLATHGSALAGSLADVLLASSLRFERGRLAAGQTRFASAAERCAVRGHPLWATVEELTTDDPELVADPMMRSLRAAHGLGLSAFASVCRGERPLPLEELTVWTSTLDAGSPADRAAIANARCLPRLRHLRWVIYAFEEPVTAARLRWLLESPFGRALDELELRPGLSTLDIDRASFAAVSQPRVTY